MVVLCWGAIGIRGFGGGASRGVGGSSSGGTGKGFGGDVKGVIEGGFGVTKGIYHSSNHGKHRYICILSWVCSGNI